ncbi:carbohydrate ABC transporter permease [Saccharopolyspora sp. MS10]|uniref:carbohydrate ABC transporter permease n=1 Tax=Saccharopolyspora sp. MS10 TaxID=3385973 RepID=UPI00399EE986
MSRHGMPAGRSLPYLLLVPALVAEVLVHLLPVLGGLWMSLHELNQFFLRDWSSAPFAGLDNYRFAVDFDGAAGAELLRSFGVTVAFSVTVVALSSGLGLLGAALLQRPFRGRFLVRGLFLVPYALPAYAAVLLWKFMLDRGNGAVNAALGGLGWGGEQFWLLGDNAFPSLVVTAVWRLWPFAFLALLAGMQAIPAELHDAAEVDGAGPAQRFRLITLPLLRPIALVLVLVLFLWTFNDFTTPYVLFDQSVPAAANVVSVHVYQSSFLTWNFGLGAAMSVLVVLFLLAVVALFLALTRRGGRAT